MPSLEKVVMVIAAALLSGLAIFASGFAYSHYKIWPTRDLILFVSHVKQYAETGLWGRAEQFFPAEVRVGDPRVRIHEPEQLPAGYRAILGYDVDLGSYSVRLIDGAGAQVHVWPIDHDNLTGGLAFGEEFIPHGMALFQDGSVVVNFDRLVGVIVRLDPCGRPVWKKDGIHHHSVEADGAGGIWTWYSPDHPSGQLQSIVRLDTETGETLVEIPLQKVIEASPQNALILGVPEDFQASPAKRIPRNQDRDIFHPNDVEPLSADLASRFDMFEAGDLLISLRNLNLVAVLDPDTLSFDWAMHGPWIRQHDPDFMPDGTIEIYDNATGRGRSDIISVDPANKTVWRRYGAGSPAYYSAAQGKHQRMPTGGSLITVPKEGRVLELSRTGELVFEFNNIAAEGFNAVVLNAEWVPEDFFETQPVCTQP